MDRGRLAFLEEHDWPTNCYSIFRTTAKAAIASHPREEIMMYPVLVDLSAKTQKPQRSLEPLPLRENPKTGKPLKTLFLNPPSFEKFDGGASSRWPATREIESYWYPVWLTFPAGMLEGSRLATLRLITSRGGRSSLSSRITSSLCS